MIQAWQHYNVTGRYDSLVIVTEPFLKSSAAMADTHAVLYSGLFIAQAHMFMENNDSVLCYLDMLSDYDRYAERNEEYLYLALKDNLKGIYALKANLDYSEALSTHLKGLGYAEAIDDTVNVVVALSNIINIYLARNDPNGVSYAEKAYELARSESVPAFIRCNVSILMAQIYCVAEEYEKALAYIEEAAFSARHDGFDAIYSLIYSVCGQIYSSLGDKDNAEEAYVKALDYANYAEPSTLSTLYLNYGLYCERYGRMREAEALLKKGVDISFRHDNLISREELLRHLTELYDRSGRPDSAMVYFRRYMSCHDSIASLQREQEFGKMVLEMHKMESANQLQSKELALLKANRRTIVICAGFTFVIVVAVFIWLLYARQRRTYKALVAQHQSYMQRIDSGIVSDGTAKDENRLLYEKLEELMKSGKVYRQKDISLEKMADMLGSNRTYLSKAINECSGMSFSNYINMYRISDATRLISRKDFDMPMKQLADLLGFNSPSVFYKAFQKETGCTPSRYRKEVSAGDMN